MITDETLSSDIFWGVCLLRIAMGFLYTAQDSQNFSQSALILPRMTLGLCGVCHHWPALQFRKPSINRMELRVFPESTK